MDILHIVCTSRSNVNKFMSSWSSLSHACIFEMHFLSLKIPVYRAESSSYDWLNGISPEKKKIIIILFLLPIKIKPQEFENCNILHTLTSFDIHALVT